MLLMCSEDLPAKAVTVNMKQFNGEYGCLHCEHKGVPRPSCHLHRNWPYEADVVPRTHSSIMTAASKAVAGNKAVSRHIKHITIVSLKLVYTCISGCSRKYINNLHKPTPVQEKGIKGASVFCLHQPFNLAKGFVIDPLHCIFLGVVLNLLEFWFGQKYSGCNFNIRRKVHHYA